MRETRRRIALLEREGKTVKLFCVGRKARDLLRRDHGSKIVGSIDDAVECQQGFDLETARDAGVVIVQSSRAGSGRVALRRYLEEAGMVAADNLNPQKARILLMLALTKSQDIGEIRRIFDTY